MARQKGILKLEGTIGDLTFYRSQGRFLAREKGGVDASRIQNDPAFERTRENGSEFGRAGSSGKLLRNSLRELLLKASDSRMVSRLTKEMMRALKMDSTNIRGARNVIDGDLSILSGFDFNQSAKLNTTAYFPYTITVDRPNGDVEINIPAFVPANGIAAPAGSTHARLIAGTTAVDFAGNVFEASNTLSANLLIGPQTEAPITLATAVSPASTWAIFVAFGIEFFQEVNGNMYPLKNGAFNALSLVAIDLV
jgi:hypothetical protein